MFRSSALLNQVFGGHRDSPRKIRKAVLFIWPVALVLVAEFGDYSIHGNVGNAYKAVVSRPYKA
jgi:hypothetical protein